MTQETPRTITTTLYDVISALHTQMGLHDAQVITALVVHLLRTGQITFHRKWPTDHGWIERHDDGRLDDSSSVLPVQIGCQLASCIAPWEQPQAGAGLAEGAYDGQAAYR